MSLRRNIYANYVSQIYVAAVGILTVPLYVRYMGTEAYGLIGFYAMLQAWFQLLDAGLSTTLARESARFKGGATDAAHIDHLRRMLERVFLAIGAAGLAAFAFAAPAIATRWLRVDALPVDDVVECVRLMGAVVAFRWMSCLYRGVVTGFEQQVWLSGANVAIASARFVLCLPLVAFVDARPSTYFWYQAAVAALEAAWLWRKSATLLPAAAAMRASRDELPDLRATLRFASGVAFTSVVWVLVTQSDKLALSKLLPLAGYGEYTLAVLLSGGISLLSGPISTALLPRLTLTAAEGNELATRALYRRYTQVVCIATVPAAFTLQAFGPQVLHAWTGNPMLAASAAPVLGLYALGNAVLGVTAFAYYIQYAKGDIRLHLLGNAVFAALYLPTVVAAAVHHGAPGAAFSWLVMNLLYLACWVPLVHRRLLPGEHLPWLTQDVLAIAAAAALPWLALAWTRLPVMTRLQDAVAAAGFLATSLACALLGSSVARGWLGRRLRPSMA